MATATQSTDRPQTGRTVRAWPVLAGAVGALILAGLVLALFALRRPAATYPAHSPQRAVQRYLALLQAGNVDRAYAMTRFPPSTAFGTPQSNFHQQWDNWSDSSHRVTLVRANRSGHTASVTVDVTGFSASEFGPTEYTNRMTFTLVRANSMWRITGPQYAYLP
jgi:hypothetical protein